MTEQEAVIRFDFIRCALLGGTKPEIIPNEDNVELMDIAIKALEEVQQYREIGTVEECREAVEKQMAKKPIEKEMPYSEVTGFNSEWHCPCCGSYIGFFTEGMSEPEQMEYCNNCGQHIAKDWSDE